jgi:tagatose-6-phosphate ketose/aldose isomerase
LGSGSFAGLRQEGALKMMELTNGTVVAGSQSALAFRHGPKTVINDKTITLHFISNEPFTAKYDVDLLKEIYRERGENRVIAFYNKDIDGVEADYILNHYAEDFTIGEDICLGLKALVFMQLLAMFKSLALGITTDNPAPGGRVNRVVQGVTIYPYKLER